MESWHEHFENEVWINEMLEKDELAFFPKYYLIGGGSLKDEIKCMLNDECKFGINVGKGEDVKRRTDKGKVTVGPTSYTWVFCYNCNRIYHLACQGHRTDDFKQKKLNEPYVCNACVENPLNEYAKEFYANRDSFDLSMDKRREYFMKVFVDLSITAESKKSEDQSQSVDMNDKLREEIKRLEEKLKMKDDVNKDLKAEVSKLRREAVEAKHDRSQPSTSRQPQKLKYSTSTIFSSSHVNDSDDNLMQDPALPNTTFVNRMNESCLHVPKRKSLIDNIDLNNLSRNELITLEQAQAQIEATDAQREIAYTQQLTVIRKALPRITKFNGDPQKWIRFRRDVDRYKSVGKYDDYEMGILLLQSLEGLALARVEGSIDKVPYQNTMKVLQKCFGEPMRIIDKCAKDILAIKLPKDLFKDDVLSITSKIQEYEAACLYAEVPTQNSNQLGTHIFDQLSLLHKIMFRHRYREEHRTDCRIIDLDNMYDFLETLADDLEDKKIDDKKLEEKKPKGFQVNVTSFGAKTERSNPVKSTSNFFSGGKQFNDYMFEIKDMNVNNLGYDLKALELIEKYCECCKLEGHYTVQCRKYREMNASDRLQFVNGKGICRNCIVTVQHRAVHCTLKGWCGFREGNEVCKLKHHITLHRAFSNKGFTYAKSNNNNNNGNNGNNGNRNSGSQTFRRNNSAFNQRRADSIFKRSQTQTSNSGNPTKHPAITVDEMIAKAPTISSLPANQVAFFNSQPRSVDLNNSASGSCSEKITEKSTPIVVSVDALGSQKLCRTVKVFKTLFYGFDKGVFIENYSLGDSAAEVTLINEDLREFLGIEGINCELQLQWTDGTTKNVEATKIDITIKGLADYCEEIELKNCYAVPDLFPPRRSLDVSHLKEKFPYLKEAEFESYDRILPAMLIGSPHASVFENIGKLLEGGIDKPVGMRTKLGWTIYGGCPDDCCKSSCNVASVNLRESMNDMDDENLSTARLTEVYEYFCSIESLGIANKTARNTEEEQRALDILSKGMKILEDGSIEVPFAWNCNNNNIPKLPNNFAMVYMRQLAHERKLLKNPLHMKAYNDNFRELLSENFGRPLDECDLSDEFDNIGFIPMTGVINSNKDPPKHRIVFDASARFRGVSLNDYLLKGPDLLVNLVKPLLRMRENEIAFVADIKSMYMRVKMNLRDQQLQRVLWRPNPNEEFRVFVFSSMLFGPKSSPFTSQFVKNATADKWLDRYPDAANTIKKYMYMDDLLTSESSLLKAVSIAKQCIEIFDSINWKLISFQSNSVEFLKSLPVTSIAQDTIPLFESEKDACITKVLGCVWDTKSDSFVFKFDKNLFIKIVKDCQHRPTKRDQSSTIARIFDVLGLISHFTIRGKILIQRSWLNDLDWNDEVSEIEHIAWKEWLNDIENISKLKIPRRFNSLGNLSECELVELHTFADAGGEAFAAVSYIVCTVNDERLTSLVMAKAKVTPIRHKSRTQISEMPRLELCACLIASRLANTIVSQLPHIKFKRYFWTDSQVVLRWIVKPNHRLLKYAVSPIDEILENSLRNEWRYVPSKLNVADIATKFHSFDFGDSQSVWFTGPQFLRQTEEHWPEMPNLLEPPVVVESLMLNVVNVDSEYVVSSQSLPPLSCSLLDDCFVDDFRASIKSNWDKLVRATARALKIVMYGLVPLLKSKKFNDPKKRKEIKERNKGFRLMGTSDLERARHFIVRKAQRNSYTKEYECMIANREINNTELQQLSVFMDAECLMRINARINLSYDFYPQKYAPLMPRKHWLTKLYLEHVHARYQHIHLESQIAFVRNEFWIPQIRVELNAVKDNCNFCGLQNAKPYIPKMAPLPECRTNPLSRPFETTGLDCMGPYTILNYTRPKKIWVLIFACTLTRFIHLRILQSLESIKVLEAIVEFHTMHGPVRTFLSDRGTNFIGASNVIEEDRKVTMKLLEEQNEILTPELINKYNVEWKLLPAHSPWMGGLYERLIKEVKRAVAHVMNNRKLTATEFNIALHDAAHRINNRPLTHNAVSADDAPILTPHLLAKGRSGWPYLPGLQSLNVTDGSCDRLLYRRGRAVADEIMKRFYNLYLPVLTKRVKWFKDQKPITVGDLVLLIEPNETRKEWRRARVVKVYKGRDGRTRVADVEMPDKKIKKYRSIQRLAKIEIKTDA